MNSMRITFPFKRNFFYLLIFLTIAAVSCKKGDTGPAGATGDTGAAGAAGPQGPQGPTGSANVIYSSWFTASPWIKDTVFDVYGFNYTKSTTDITQAILDSGTVITFGKLAGYNTLVWPTGTVSQLPIVINYKFSTGGITYTDTWSALATPNKLKIRFVNDQNYYGSIATAHQFRYIIIPGAVKGNSAGKHSRDITATDAAGAESHGSIDYSQMSYEEICNYLNIPQ